MSKKRDHAGLFALLGLVLVLPFAAWYGFVIKTIWGWFVAPLGVVQIGVWEAAGVYLLIRMLTMDTTLPRDDKKSPAEKFGELFGYGLIVPACTLGFAAIYHAFS